MDTENRPISLEVLQPLDRRMSAGRRLVQDFSITINGVSVLIPAGFDWDGATIPRLFWSIVGSPFDARVIRASLVHDWLYWMRIEKREVCDKIFLDLCLADGMSRVRARLMYWAVRGFGGLYFVRKQPDIDYAVALLDCLRQHDRSDFYGISQSFSL